MTVAEIIDGINAKKLETGMTNQQISDSSGVPKSTVDRILRGATDNPSLQNILEIANAVGFIFGPTSTEMLPLPDVHEESNPFVRHIMAIYENRIAMYEERIKQEQRHYYMLLAEKNRWIRFSLILNIVLVLFICSILVYDVLHPDIGWIRQQLNASIGGEMRNMMVAVWEWISGRL